MTISFAEKMVRCTVRIQTNLAVGTGFLFMFMHNPANSRGTPAIVTNRHVVTGATKIDLFLDVRDRATNEIEKFGFTIVNPDNLIVYHGDNDVDLATIDIVDFLEEVQGLGKSLAGFPLTESDIANSSHLLGMSPIEDIIMVGYPNGLWDEAANRPIARRGITATHAAVPYKGKCEFLIDCACFPGSSGSPIFQYFTSNFPVNKGNVERIEFTKLIGILYSGPLLDVKGAVETIEVNKLPNFITSHQMMMNLGHCIQARELLWFENRIRKYHGVEEIQ